MKTKPIKYDDILIKTHEDAIVKNLYNVKENEIERIIKEVQNRNKNAYFYNIIYSKIENKLSFYTDIPITIEKDTSKDTLEELKIILSYNLQNDNDSISIYNILLFIKKTIKTYKTTIKKFEKELKDILKNISSYTSVEIEDFNFSKNELKIKLKHKVNGEKYLTITKKLGKIYIIDNDLGINIYKILPNIELKLLELYETILEYKNCINDYRYNIETINSSFTVDIDYYHITIKKTNNQILFSVTPSNLKYEYTSKENIDSFIQDHEKEILQKLFIKIEECPNWIQEHFNKSKKLTLKISKS